MTEKREPSYGELKRRLEAAESHLRALQGDQADAASRASPSLKARLADAEAREAHIKRVLIAIRSVNRLIVREHDQDRLLQGACDLLTETRGYHTAWIARLNREGEPVISVHAGFGEAFAPLQEMLDGGGIPPCMRCALNKTESVVVKDSAPGCTYCPLESNQTNLGGMAVALEYEKTVYGSLCTTLPASLAQDPEEQALLQEIAGDLAFALHIIELEDARGQALQELEDSEAMLRMIFENAFDGISIHEEVPGTRDRRLIDCNERYAEMAGRSKVELLEAENTARFQQKLDPPRSTDENRRLREGKLPYRGTFSWIRPDQRENVIEYTAVPIEVGGRPLTVGIDRDITEKVKAMSERERALESLAESQRQLSTLMSNLPGMAYRCLNEPDRPMVFVSEGCRELAGYTTTEMTHSAPPSYGDLIHPADRQWVWNTIREAVEAEKPFVLEYRIYDKKGEERWVWERGHIAPKRANAPIYLEGFISDITERKQAEENLRLFKAIVENSSEAIAISDPEGRLVYINEAHAELFGRSLEEARRANYRDFYPPESVEILDQDVAPALAQGDSWEGELDVYDATGRRFPLWERADSIRDTEGNLLFAFGLMHDISERREIEQALRESERQKALILNSAAEMIAYYDTDLNVIWANRASAESVGESPEALVGKHCYEIWERRSRPCPDCPVLKAFESKQPQQIERRTADGRYWHLRGYPVLDDDGEVIGLAEFGQDITERKRIEHQREVAAEALRESEKKYRTLFEEALNPIMLVDKEGGYVGANQAALDFLACEKDDLLSKNVWDFSPPGRIEQQQQEHAPFEERRILETDYWVRGRVKTLLLNVVPLEVGEEVFIYGIGQDITERKRIAAQRKEALEAMRESEVRYRTLFETANDAIFIMEGNTFIACNEAAVQMFGCEAESDLIDHTPSDFSPPIQLDGQRSEQQALTYIEATMEGVPQHFDWKHRKKDGTLFDTEISLNRLNLGGELFLQAIVRDVTKRKQAEEDRIQLTNRIREQARQMTHILETVPAGVLLLDDQEQVVEANPVAEQALNLLAEARIGDTLTHLGDRSLHELLTSPPTQGLWHEVNTESPSGARTFEVIAKPVANGPEPEQWVLVVNEVTQEREIRAQLQRQEQLAAVGQLAAGIAHDFNNIMAVIVLYTQMGLRAPDLSPRLRERLNVIDQQAKRATTLIQQILDFGGRAMLERRPMDLVPFLKETVKLLQRTIPEHISISLTFGMDTYTVDADPTRLQQMLTNLAVNARDAMPDGGALRFELHKLHLKPAEPPPVPDMEIGSWVQLTVADTGTGMPDEVLAHLFEPFYTTKEPGTGTGLGLAQVHGIVSQHDGAINVETEAGVGTTFTIYLPALDTPAIEPSPPEIQPPSQGQGEVVLVVEDESIVRAALVESLEAWNYRTMEAANGEEAMAAVDAYGDEIDLVLSDVVMPGMGGIALFHALNEQQRSIPVMLLTGHAMENELDALKTQGLVAWLTKPPSLERLGREIRNAVDK